LAARPSPVQEGCDSVQQTADPGNSHRESGHRPGPLQDADGQDASRAQQRRQAGTTHMPEWTHQYARDALLPAFEVEYRLLRCRVIFHFQLDIMTPVRFFEIQRRPATIVTSIWPLAGDKSGKLVHAILDIGGVNFLHRAILQRLDLL